jgi:hypothetical protein
MVARAEDDSPANGLEALGNVRLLAIQKSSTRFIDPSGGW